MNVDNKLRGAIDGVQRGNGQTQTSLLLVDVCASFPREAGGTCTVNGASLRLRIRESTGGFQEYHVPIASPQKPGRVDNNYDKLVSHAILLHLAETCDPHSRKPVLSKKSIPLPVSEINRNLDTRYCKLQKKKQ